MTKIKTEHLILTLWLFLAVFSCVDKNMQAVIAFVVCSALYGFLSFVSIKPDPEKALLDATIKDLKDKVDALTILSGMIKR